MSTRWSMINGQWKMLLLRSPRTLQIKESCVKDEMIIVGCKKKNPVYQKVLVDRYAAVLFTVSRRYAADEHIARDILQESYIKIFGAIQNFDENKGTLEGWMRKIVLNTALSRFKKSSYLNEKTSLESVQEREVIPDAYAMLGAEELMELINDLPVAYRTVFNLHVVEGYKHREIAKLLDIPEGTSRSNLKRARTLLQKIIRQAEKVNYGSKAI